MLVFFGKFCERHKRMIPNFYQYFLRLLRFPDLDCLMVCLTYLVGTEKPVCLTYLVGAERPVCLTYLVGTEKPLKNQVR